MVTNTIVIWLAPKNMSYEKVPVNTKQGTSYKCISYKNMHCFTELQNYHLRYVSFLYILIPKQNQGCCSPESSVCLHCTRGQKLQWYPAPVLASLLHPPTPTSHTHTHTHTAVLYKSKQWLIRQNTLSVWMEMAGRRENPATVWHHVVLGQYMLDCCFWCKDLMHSLAPYRLCLPECCLIENTWLAV